jgi:predicted DsbA family dithiol-disulfide isomerase
MAMESAYITADVIEVTEFPELLQKYQVRGVPMIVFKEDLRMEGALSETAFLEKVIEAGQRKT